ncbi:uncharacterized protein A4U43_C03F6470 [Asparagus officinalis]|uniref:GIR1-like zinc ribbon domain-containing protein n=1 Tax=Asparagus officinalis TaxID=4686 RepID=A0A5P1F7V3_ASPOF|nr:uncharacterized protein LOC109832099 [Asparagus officinalis]ONK74456.1 uncharacterized protein A4U43_C03F6470 [Asparagus officinalis]
MAADVSSVIRIMSEYNNDEKKSKRGDLVTRDFLGCAVTGSKELDLDLKVPSGFQRRLDLLSGETYVEKSGPVHRELQDLNLPPTQVDSSAIDLRLLLPSAPRGADRNYQSVCTLDKVRSALERAERESQSKGRPPRSDGSNSPSSSSSTTTSSSIKRRGADQETDGSDSSRSLIAAGCPICLMYVLISKANPRCPRCDSHVPAPTQVVAKRPRIDLNSL